MRIWTPKSFSPVPLQTFPLHCHYLQVEYSQILVFLSNGFETIPASTITVSTEEEWMLRKFFQRSRHSYNFLTLWWQIGNEFFCHQLIKANKVTIETEALSTNSHCWCQLTPSYLHFPFKVLGCFRYSPAVFPLRDSILSTTSLEQISHISLFTIKSHFEGSRALQIENTAEVKPEDVSIPMKEQRAGEPLLAMFPIFSQALVNFPRAAHVPCHL